MLRYNQYQTRIFLAPDADPSGAPASGGGQQQQQGSQGANEDDPFKGLDLDDLDSETRKVVETARERVTSLQSKNTEFQKKVDELDRQSKTYQSRHDQLQHQLNRLTGGQGQGNGLSEEAREKADKIAQYEQVLKQKGVPDAAAKAQAELMFDLFLVERETIKKEMGREMAPFASLQLNREAEQAFLTASQGDITGAMQDPEFAKEIWDMVTQGAQNGQVITPIIVQNLIGMTYYNYISQGKTFGEPQQTQSHFPSGQPPMPQLPNLGRGTYPGAGNAPQRRVAPDPRAPRHQLNSETATALKIVTGEWGKAGQKAPINK